MFCNVRPDCVIENLTMPMLVSRCPLMLEAAGIDDTVVARQLHLDTPPTGFDRVERSLSAALPPAASSVTVALVGKYVQAARRLSFALVESPAPRRALRTRASVRDPVGRQRTPRRSGPAAPRQLRGDVDGILVPGGFGDRGIEGMMPSRAVRPRERRPLLWASVWACRSRSWSTPATCCGYADANSSEFAPEGPAQRHRPDARPAGRRDEGRHDASGRVPLRHHAPARIWRDCYGKLRDLRAPPPPLRVQQRVPRRV